MAKLTHKQKLFCAAYLANNGNGTQAAITAGYSKHTAAGAAGQNLRKPWIKQYIAAKQEIILARLDVTADAVAQEHAKIAFSDFDAKNVTIADKRGSLDSLGKHLGMFVDRHHIEGEITFEAFKRRYAEDV
jgi:phage terminase small subunit